MRKTKRFVTLLEVVIAMALVSVLMTVLMSYYGQIAMIQGEVNSAREEGFQLRYLQARLSYVLPRIVPVRGPVGELDKRDDFYFYSQEENELSPSLVFTYDNGIDLDARFSNHVLGRLMLDEKDGHQRLMLYTWPVPRCWTKDEEQPPMKKEVLVDRITDVDFQFYYPPDPAELPGIAIRGLQSTPVGNEQDKPAKDQWMSRWYPSYMDLPAVVKVRVKRTVQTGLTPAGQWIDMAFPLPNSRKAIAVTQP
ncbi:MAG: hypothetical protein Q8K75_09120 [Chlamydiales bacterium]|nr:hypothetical protein [Chlamydiales bacterium]